MKKEILILFFAFLSYPAAAKWIKTKIPDKLVVLTFDDASASHYGFVAPLLKKYGFGATFFVCEFPPNFKDSSKCLNWRQIKELDKMGFEVANHTRTHPAISHLSREQFIDQLNYIEKKCDSTGIARPLSFAYPGYDLNRAAVDILQEKGYLFARIGGNRVYNPLTDHPLLIPSWAMGANNKEEVLAAFKEARDGKIVVLTIHGVPDTDHQWVTTPPELFNEHIQYLSDNHYKVIALKDLSKYVNVKKAMKKISPGIPNKQKN